MLCRRGLSRCVQKHKRTLRPTRRAVAEFIYHYHGELNHQGLGNAFVFLDTTRSYARTRRMKTRESERGGAAPKACSQTRRKLAKSKPSKTTFRPTPVHRQNCSAHEIKDLRSA